jgi:ribosomal protein S4E
MKKSLAVVEKILEPIELDDSEVAAVAGGVNQTSTQTVNATQTSTQTANATLTNSTFSGGSFSF